MALTNVREFNLGIDTFIEEAEERRQQLTRIVSLQALRDLVFGTRVDTGRARGNWQVEEGSPPVGFLPEQFDKVGSATINVGSAVIASASGTSIIWLHNGVPYIQILENWDGMLEGAYQAALTWLRTVRRQS